MVQLVGKTKLDARPGNNRSDLANSLPDYPCRLRLRVRTEVSRQGRWAGCIAVRHQPCGEFNLYADPIWDARPALSSRGYSRRLGNDHLVRHRHLAALHMRCHRSSSLFHLGVTGDHAATVDRRVHGLPTLAGWHSPIFSRLPPATRQAGFREPRVLPA
jgi:hypothetical protein